MKSLRSILSAGLALALFSTGVRAETFPIFEDTAGSPLAGTIPKAAGAAKTLAVSGKSNAYINFSVSSSGIDPAAVTAARLIIYLPKASATGTLTIKNLSAAFEETFVAKIIPAPALGATVDTVDLAAIPLNRQYFIIDVTTLVKSWLTTPASEFGIAITSDGVALATLASKEGAGSGHPAFIEVDVNRPGGPVAGTSATFSGNVAGSTFNGSTFVGSGASLTSLAADNISTGTVADARLSANVALRDGANTFTGTQTAPAFVGNGTIPIGGIIMWSGSNPPAGWLICDGTNGTPDLRGRSIQGFGIGRAIGATGGSESKTLSIGELPSHSFNVSSTVKTLGYTASYNGTSEAVSAPGNGQNIGSQSLTGVTNSIGSNQSFSMLTPYYVLAFIQRVQ